MNFFQNYVCSFYERNDSVNLDIIRKFLACQPDIFLYYFCKELFWFHFWDPFFIELFLKFNIISPSLLAIFIDFNHYPHTLEVLYTMGYLDEFMRSHNYLGLNDLILAWQSKSLTKYDLEPIFESILCNPDVILHFVKLHLIDLDSLFEFIWSIGEHKSLCSFLLSYNIGVLHGFFGGPVYRSVFIIIWIWVTIIVFFVFWLLRKYGFGE